MVLPWMPWIRVYARLTTEAFDVIESNRRFSWAVVLDHMVGLWKCLVIVRQTILEARDALVFARLWFCMIPSTSAEALRRNASAFQLLPTFCLGHWRRVIAGQAESMTYSWIIANASWLNWSEVIAKS